MKTKIQSQINVAYSYRQETHTNIYTRKSKQVVFKPAKQLLKIKLMPKKKHF